MKNLTVYQFKELKNRYDKVGETNGISTTFTKRLMYFTNYCDKLNLNPSKVKAVFDRSGGLDDIQNLHQMEFGCYQDILERGSDL